MLKHLKIKASETSPYVSFDPAGRLEIKGRSLMEDVVSFFNPLLHWIDEFLKNPPDKILIYLELEYFNSLSARMIVKLLMKFEPIKENTNTDIKVIWRYKPNDDIMRDRGKEFKTIVLLPFELEEIKV